MSRFPEYEMVTLRNGVYMDAPELVALETIVKDLPNKSKIFEWGSGFSTLYFPRVLVNMGKEFTWYAAEHSRAWFDLIGSRIIDGVVLKLFEEDRCGGRDTDAEHEICEDSQMKDYLGWIDTLGKFDMVFVDGVKRSKCLYAAKNHLKKNGFILLHDAEREHYHKAMWEYKGTYLTENTNRPSSGILWRGTI